MTRLHLSQLIFIQALWGLNMIAGKAGTATFGPLLFITLRFAIVFVLLVPFLRPVAGQMRMIVGIGLILGIGHYAFLFYAIHVAGSLSSVAIASQLTVPLSTLLAIVFLGERIGLPRALAITVSFLGVAIIAAAPIGGPTQVFALGLTAVASLAMAVAAIFMRRLEGVGTFNLQAWIALSAMVSMGLVTCLIERPAPGDLLRSDPLDYVPALYSAVGATIIGHGLLYRLLQRYPVNDIAPFITLSTVFAVGFGVWLLDDPLTLRIVIGGLFVLGGVTVIAVRNAAREAPSGVRVPH